MAIKKVTKDYGLRAHEVELITPETSEEVQRCVDKFRNMMGPDEAREHNADLFRQILEDDSIADPHDSSIATKCVPECFHVLGAEWLQVYHTLAAVRARVENGDARRSDVSMLVYLAEELGKLKERIWWRHGVDPVTGEKRETLALRGCKEKKTSRAGHEKVYGSEAEKIEKWKEIVAIFNGARRDLMSVGDAEKHAAKKCGVSSRTVRRARERLGFL